MITKRWIGAGLLLCPLHAFCQQAVVSADQTRLLYHGIDNAISIAVPGYASEDLRVQSSTCRVSGGNGHFTVRPDSLKTAVLVIRSEKQQRIIDSVSIPVKQLPDLYAVLATGKNTGTILKDKPSVAGEGNNMDMSGFFKIISYTVTLCRGPEILYHKAYTDEPYDTALLLAIEHATPGDMLFWEDIRVLGPDKSMRYLASVQYIKTNDGPNWRRKTGW